MFCSVIVPIYNSEAFLNKCIDSILCQNSSLFELILVNDGSTDNSQFICENYKKTYDNVVVINKENGGHTSARNAGLEVAKGEYVIFVDSDDWIDPNLISDCYQIIQKHAVDIILYGYRRVSESAVIEKPQVYPAGHYDKERIEDEILPTILTCGRFSLSERMLKREIAMKFQKNVNTQIKVGEDMLCCVLSLCHVENLYVLDSVYYNYYQHTNSVIHNLKNYTFTDWDLIRNVLNKEVRDIIPSYKEQIGVCSIRFLDRAIMGELERNNLSFKCNSYLKNKLSDYKDELQMAKTSKKALAYKLFCIKNNHFYLLYLSNRLSMFIRKIKNNKTK